MLLDDVMMGVQHGATNPLVHVYSSQVNWSRDYSTVPYRTVLVRISSASSDYSTVPYETSTSRRDTCTVLVRTLGLYDPVRYRTILVRCSTKCCTTVQHCCGDATPESFEIIPDIYRAFRE